MKRAAAVCVSSIVCVLSAAPFVACENNSGTSSGGVFDPDASTFNPPETGPLPPVDAAIDGFTPPVDAGQDAAPADTATVVVTKDGAPDPGVAVVFQSSAGAVLATVMTGADGKATNKVTAGDLITVAFGPQGNRHLITYVGVKPGDVLDVVEPTSRFLSIALTASPGVGGNGVTTAAGNFNCYTNSVSTGTVGINLLTECITGPVFPVLGLQNFNLNTYYSFKKDIMPAASGTTSISGMSAWTIGSAYTLNVTNAPSLSGVQATLGQIANNQSFSGAPESNLVLTAGAGTAPFVVAIGYGDAYQGDIQFVNFPTGFQQVQSFSKRFGAGTTQTMDLTAGVLPALATATADTTAPARPVLAWTASAALTGTDSGVATMTFSLPILDGTESIGWTFIVPPGTLTVTTPALPASLAAFTPSAASVVQVPAVAFFESDLVPSYDFVRGHAAAFGLAKVPIGVFSGALIPALPAVGTLRITALAPFG